MLVVRAMIEDGHLGGEQSGYDRRSSFLLAWSRVMRCSPRVHAAAMLILRVRNDDSSGCCLRVVLAELFAVAVSLRVTEITPTETPGSATSIISVDTAGGQSSGIWCVGGAYTPLAFARSCFMDGKIMLGDKTPAACSAASAHVKSNLRQD